MKWLSISNFYLTVYLATGIAFQWLSFGKGDFFSVPIVWVVLTLFAAIPVAYSNARQTIVRRRKGIIFFVASCGFWAMVGTLLYIRAEFERFYESESWAPMDPAIFGYPVAIIVALLAVALGAVQYATVNVSDAK